jgi:hypothetical protein
LGLLEAAAFSLPKYAHSQRVEHGARRYSTVDTVTLYLMRANLKWAGSSPQDHAMGRRFEERIDRSAFLPELNVFR